MCLMRLTEARNMQLIFFSTSLFFISISLHFSHDCLLLLHVSRCLFLEIILCEASVFVVFVYNMIGDEPTHNLKISETQFDIDVVLRLFLSGSGAQFGST